MSGRYTQFALQPECVKKQSAVPLADLKAARYRIKAIIFAAVIIGLPALGFIGENWLVFSLWVGTDAIIAYFFARTLSKSKAECHRRLWNSPYPIEGEKILLDEIGHFQRLDEPGKDLFRQRGKLFLGETVFHGAGVEVDERLRQYAATAAVIPTLGFPEWDWTELREIIFRPEGSTNASLVLEGGVVAEFDESGMIGETGVFAGVMMLSSEDLFWEFAHPESGENVGFHEFAHLMADKGILAEINRDEWNSLYKSEKRRIKRDDSLLDDYALVDEDEFFAVASELFFTIPGQLRREHPALHAVLVRAYRQDPSLWYDPCDAILFEKKPARRRKPSIRSGQSKGPHIRKQARRV